MLPEVHDALRRVIYQQGRISPLEVDVEFEAPTRAWIDRLIRPTVSFFLFEVLENTEMRTGGYQVQRGHPQAIRRLPPRRVDLQYMVSALTTDIGDEHRLLWRVLAALLRTSELPPELIGEGLASLETPITSRVAQPDQAPRMLDIWSALNADPRPALHYVVTVPLDLEVALEVPLVLTRTIRYHRIDEGGLLATLVSIGGVVRGAGGEPLPGILVTREGSAGEGSRTDEFGRFRLPNVPAGSVTLRATRPDGTSRTRELDVPTDSYDISLD